MGKTMGKSIFEKLTFTAAVLFLALVFSFVPVLKAEADEITITASVWNQQSSPDIATTADGSLTIIIDENIEIHSIDVPNADVTIKSSNNTTLTVNHFLADSVTIEGGNVLLSEYADCDTINITGGNLSVESCGLVLDNLFINGGTVVIGTGATISGLDQFSIASGSFKHNSETDAPGLECSDVEISGGEVEVSSVNAPGPYAYEQRNRGGTLHRNAC